MFVAYFAQSVQSNSSGSQQLQMERFDEFGDPIDDYQMVITYNKNKRYS